MFKVVKILENCEEWDCGTFKTMEEANQRKKECGITRTHVYKMNMDNNDVKLIKALFDSSKNAWIKYNNSGNDTTSKKWESVSKTAERKALEKLHTFGASAEMPGLDPLFKMDKKEFYTIEQLQSYINNKY